MKQLITLIFMMNFGLHPATAGNVVVRFEAHASTLYPYTRVFIAGSFNNWSPGDSAYILKAAGGGNFALELSLPEGRPVEYKVHIGSLDRCRKAI